jgi:seryl-tRNA synthetase
MLDLRNLVSHPATIEETLTRRNKPHLIPLVSSLIELDKERRVTLQTVEGLKAKRNEASQEISKIKKAGGDDKPILLEMKQVSTEVKLLDEKLNEIEAKVKLTLLELPNLLDGSVPPGQAASDNVEYKRVGSPKTLSGTVRSHDEIGEALKILDFKKAGEVAGSRFVFLRGIAARLERALIQFMLDVHAEAGYEEILPPFIVNRDALVGTGQLPKFEEDVFKLQNLEYFLIPTAEVPVTNYHRHEILDEKELPRKYVAYTPCFRSEAGSYGKDTKGLKRQHQFEKVELVQFVKPEDSLKTLDLLLGHAERVLQLLDLPYRVVTLCGGDIGFNSAKTYDIEVWSPFTKSFMEISSCSLYTDYQARRANIRYRDQAGKVQFVHTLNGSGLAVGRTLLAIMENYQTPDGNFTIPEKLKPYLESRLS